jgi:NAD(P)-dependent dehydrogenase (short-subunit alcohol dehydrogenase family)
MGRVEGKVTLISGAARGQGRAHALRQAQEGAKIVAFDACTSYDSVPYSMPTLDDLKETERLVTEAGGEIVVRQGDVRDPDQVEEMFGRAWELTKQQWDEMIDVNLTGVFNTIRAATPRLIDQGEGGSLILTSSVAGTQGMRNVAHYVAAKHGVIGLMRAFSNETAEFNIRVNAICPTTVSTDMILFVPDDPAPSREQAGAALMRNKPFNTPWVEPVDVANVGLWLASDESRYITGIMVPVLGGPV